MAEPRNPQALLTALTTEHFTLQGARSTTVSENTGRSSLYLTAVSSALVALGFIGQVSAVGETFRLFSLAVIPVLFWLGLLTYVRVLEKSIEDLFYARAINRIRHYYLELAGDDSGYFLLGGNDDVAGVFSNMATSPSRGQLLYSSATTSGAPWSTSPTSDARSRAPSRGWKWRSLPDAPVH